MDEMIFSRANIWIFCLHWHTNTCWQSIERHHRTMCFFSM